MIQLGTRKKKVGKVCTFGFLSWKLETRPCLLVVVSIHKPTHVFICRRFIHLELVFFILFTQCLIRVCTLSTFIFTKVSVKKNPKDYVLILSSFFRVKVYPRKI